MKQLNEEATRIFMGIIQLLPEDGHLKIENNSAYMPLSVEKLYNIKYADRTATVYSLCHYYEQNGDPMRDPDVEFAVIDLRDAANPILEMIRVFPISFRNDGMGIDRQHVVTKDGRITHFNERAQRDCAQFCNKWMDNIKHQQGIAAAKILNLRQFSAAQRYSQTLK